MILVDTSVWIDHLRIGERGLTQLLDSRQVMVHPFIVGELALGNLSQRDRVLGAMHELPQIHAATDLEVLYYIDEWALFGRGIGYVDAHLLASLRLTPGTRLWTRDQRLHRVANELGMAITDVP
jgi:predicted nucleic acid-binding protein